MAATAQRAHASWGFGGQREEEEEEKERYENPTMNLDRSNGANNEAVEEAVGP